MGILQDFFRSFKIFHDPKNLKRSLKVLNYSWGDNIIPNCVGLFTNIFSRDGAKLGAPTLCSWRSISCLIFMIDRDKNSPTLPKF